MSRRRAEGERPVASAEQAVALQALAVLNEHEAAAVLRMSRTLLQKYRLAGKGEGPRFVQFGTAVRYRRADLDAWLEAHLSPAPAADQREGERVA